MHKDLERSWLDESLQSVQRRDTSGFGSGLSRAIAQRIGVDVVIVRVAFVVLTFCSGLGLALYAWGTLLTEGPEGKHPVDGTIRSFRGWPSGAQLALIIGTTIGLVATVAATTSLPWGLAIIAVALMAWYLRRNHALRLPSVGGEPVAEPANEDELIDEWRRRMSAATGHHSDWVAPLPVIDLDAPIAVPEPTARPRTAWAASLLLILVAAAAGAGSVMVGLSAVTALAIGTLALGVGTVIFAAVSRAKRLPRPFLAAVLVPIVACGWLSTGADPLLETQAVTHTDATHAVKYFATTTTLDLTDANLAEVDTVEIVAVASTVDVLLPGNPDSGIATTERFSTVHIDKAGTTVWAGKKVVVDATASSVTIRVGEGR